jgi:hypothetical protein
MLTYAEHSKGAASSLPINLEGSTSKPAKYFLIMDTSAIQSQMSDVSVLVRSRRTTPTSKKGGQLVKPQLEGGADRVSVRKVVFRFHCRSDSKNNAIAIRSPLLDLNGFSTHAIRRRRSLRRELLFGIFEKSSSAALRHDHTSRDTRQTSYIQVGCKGIATSLLLPT